MMNHRGVGATPLPESGHDQVDAHLPAEVGQQMRAALGSPGSEDEPGHRKRPGAQALGGRSGGVDPLGACASLKPDLGKLPHPRSIPVHHQQPPPGQGSQVRRIGRPDDGNAEAVGSPLHMLEGEVDLSAPDEEHMGTGRFPVGPASHGQVQVAKEPDGDPSHPVIGHFVHSGPVPRLGAHVDTRGGLHLAFDRAAEMGADAIQVHPTPPSYWGSPKLDPDRVAAFTEAAARAGHPPFYFHAVYLINLAGDDALLRQRSESTLAGYLAAADTLGIDGVIFHTGSHKGQGFESTLPTIRDHLLRVLERADPRRSRLLIENNAGAGGCVGAHFEELAALIAAVGDPRVHACFDTCHAFASGYDLRTPEQVAETLAEWDRVVGLDLLEAVHCNDSQAGLGSNRDRHANIGEGEIGEEGFRALLSDRRLESVPFILEVPGFAGNGPDQANLDILRRLSAGAREPA